MISVIIHNYNRKETLLKAIRSCLEQTYRPIEVIVVDDGSNFDIKNFIETNFSNDYESGLLKVFINEKNFGAAKSRNIGVGKSNGNYISFLDSDDYWDSKKLDKQINKFKKNLNLDLVYCDQYLLKDGAKMSSNKKMINSSILNELINGWTAPNTSTLMYRKESFERVGGFDEKLKSCQDHDLWFKIASENFNVDYVDEPLSFFVIDSENRISYHLKNRMDGVVMFVNNVKNYFPQKKKYLIFKKKYIFKTSFPLFVSVIKKKKYLSATKVYCKYLMFNSHFYKKIKETIIKKLNKI